MERANGNGARWPEMLGRNSQPRNYRSPFGGTTLNPPPTYHCFCRYARSQTKRHGSNSQGSCRRAQ
eukprot:3000415-Pleurochrysis_carterae.AAC.1